MDKPPLKSSHDSEIPERGEILSGSTVREVRTVLLPPAAIMAVRSIPVRAGIECGKRVYLRRGRYVRTYIVSDADWCNALSVGSEVRIEGLAFTVFKIEDTQILARINPSATATPDPSTTGAPKP